MSYPSRSPVATSPDDRALSEAARAGTGEFRILATNFLLSDATKRVGSKSLIFGDVGQLASGELVYRYATTLSDGSVAATSGPFDLTIPVEERTIARPVDHPLSIRQIIEARPGDFGPLEDAREEREYVRFRQEWPAVAEFMGLHQPHEFKLFKPGVIARQRGLADEDTLRRLVADHASGDFGLDGEWDDVPLSPEQLFTIDRQPVAIANKAAIAAGLGAVRSRHKLGDDSKTVVSILTILARHGNRTLVSRGHLD